MVFLHELKLVVNLFVGAAVKRGGALLEAAVDFGGLGHVAGIRIGLGACSRALMSLWYSVLLLVWSLSLAQSLGLPCLVQVSPAGFLDLLLGSGAYN